MNLNIYAIFDSKTGIYNRPFTQHSDGEAMRTFKDLATNQETTIGQHPEDYSLARIGVYSDKTAEITPETVEILAKGHEIVALDQRQAEIPENYGGTN